MSLALAMRLLSPLFSCRIFAFISSFFLFLFSSFFAFFAFFSLAGQIVVKGVMTAEDASEAVRQGVDAIWISNHGARQLDTTPATIEVLPEVGNACPRRSNRNIHELTLLSPTTPPQLYRTKGSQYTGCRSPFMQLAEQFTALRAWCMRFMSCRGKSDVLPPGMVGLRPCMT